MRALAPHRNIPNEHFSEWQASRKACFLKLRKSVQLIDATDDRSYGRQNRQTWLTAYKSLCVDESVSVSLSLRGSCHVQAETHPVNFRMRHVLVLIVLRDPQSPGSQTSPSSPYKDLCAPGQVREISSTYACADAMQQGLHGVGH